MVKYLKSSREHSVTHVRVAFVKGFRIATYQGKVLDDWDRQRLRQEVKFSLVYSFAHWYSSKTVQLKLILMTPTWIQNHDFIYQTYA